MNICINLILDYALLGAAIFPVYMRLDKHTFTHVIETTGELVVLVVCWILLWPVIGFFVVRNHLSKYRQRPGIRRYLLLR
jgi:hypothetical protein